MRFWKRPGAVRPAFHPTSDVVPGSVWRTALAIALTGALLAGLATWWLWQRSEKESEAALAAQGEAVAGAVEDAFDEVVERLVSLGSFYQASDEVTRDEFKTFVANFEAIPGMGGIGYMPIVAPDDLAEFEASVAETIPGYTVFEFDSEGNRVPVQPRSYHVPLLWFEPEDAFGGPSGWDSTSERTRHFALIRAKTEKGPAMTSFLALVSEEDEDGFLVYWPVMDPETSEVTGFTVATMDLSDLLDDQVGGVSLQEGMAWEIEILSEGRRPRAELDNTWSRMVDVGSAWWHVRVTDVGAGAFQPMSSDVTIALVAISGLVVSTLLALGYYQNRKKSETERELHQLRALSRSKDQFLASVSHELRTPLTGVLGFAELLRDGPENLTEEERRSMISNVAEEATDLAAIIDDLLVAARSELDLLAITRVPVSLRAQVAQVLENTDERLRDRIDLVGDVRQTAVGDPGRVRQIIRNLITNALRYGGDRIEVRFGVGDGMVRVEVADNGPGPPPEDRDRIFEPYYRAHQDADTQPAALGIGLSVARHLARLMDGELSYLRDGEWSVFRLALPGAPVVTREEARRESARV